MRSLLHPRPARSRVCLAIATLFLSIGVSSASAQFRAGAATSNVTPWLGTSMNGGMSDNLAKTVHDELHARAIVLDDGKTRLAFVVVDSCMIPREVITAAKARILERSQLPADHVLISATHSHSTATAGSVFQSEPDKQYLLFLSLRIADAVERAVANLQPAQVGWGMGKNAEQVFNRRWKKKAGTIPPDPFGNKTDQVQMNPPPGSPDLIEPAGPIDPEIGIIAIRSVTGQPIAVLSAYGLHYVGGVGPGHVSADYYGLFASKLAERLKATNVDPPFVAAMANGTSGDINNINFRTASPASGPYEQIGKVADALSAEVARVAQSLTYHDHVTLDATTAEIELSVRKPTAAEVTRAQAILDAAKGKPLTTLEHVYARETVLLNQLPATVPVTLQALRIGELGIAAIPCEVFAEIGLEIKAKSVLKPVFTIELANGYNGYLPTKDQHALGGYETWRARSSYLEVDAASKITGKILELLGDLKAKVSTELSKSEDPFTLEPGFTSLFTGKDLTGWRFGSESLTGKIASADGRFVVKDGLLVITGASPGQPPMTEIDTVADFKHDFVLKLEFRASRGANSGVHLRDHEFKHQLQIRDYPRVGPYKSLKLYKEGDWNTIEVIVKGTAAVCTCNGEVLEPNLALPTEGTIALQSETNVVEYRRIRIKKMP